MNKLLKLATLLCLFALLGCSQSFSREQMLGDITNNVIVRNHESFARVARLLEESAARFAESASAENRADLELHWQAANLAWMGCTPFRFDVVADALIHNRIDNRPARVEFIEETLAGDGMISAETLSNAGSSSKGLPAIEYLLFESTSRNQLADDQRRRDYIAASASVLAADAQALLAIWSTSGDNYAQTFIESDLAAGQLQESLNLLINQMVAELEAVAMTRLGKPLGISNLGNSSPQDVEAPFGGFSLDRIKATIATLHSTYGARNVGLDLLSLTGPPAADGDGIDAYLTYLEADYNGTPLATVIDEQFVATLAALDAIDGTLASAVEDDKASVLAAYNATNDLLTLVKADMVGQLGVTLTFNDNDGD